MCAQCFVSDLFRSHTRPLATRPDRSTAVGKDVSGLLMVHTMVHEMRRFDLAPVPCDTSRSEVLPDLGQSFCGDVDNRKLYRSQRTLSVSVELSFDNLDESSFANMRGD